MWKRLSHATWARSSVALLEGRELMNRLGAVVPCVGGQGRVALGYCPHRVWFTELIKL